MNVLPACAKLFPYLQQPFPALSVDQRAPQKPFDKPPTTMLYCKRRL